MVINGVGISRGTTAPGGYPVKSNAQITVAGISKLYQINMAYSDFNVASRTVTRTLYTPPVRTGRAFAHIIEEVYIYRGTAWAGSSGITTVNAAVGVDNLLGGATDVDALIVDSDLSSSGGTFIGTSAAEKGNLLNSGPTALVMPGGTYETVTITIDSGSGKTCSNLTAGTWQVIIKYWEIPTLT